MKEELLFRRSKCLLCGGTGRIRTRVCHLCCGSGHNYTSVREWEEACPHKEWGVEAIRVGDHWESDALKDRLVECRRCGQSYAEVVDGGWSP